MDCDRMAAQVMQIPVEVDLIDPHVQFHASLGHGTQELIPMVFSLGNGRVKVVRGIKALLRNVKAPTYDALWRAVGDICALFDPQECRTYPKDAGYVAD